MDDCEALNRAVAARPDDDLPRLVLADWWEDRGEVDYATFIRAQVRLAATPTWEPFAIHCRHFRHDDWVRGYPFSGFLPRFDGHWLEWHPDYGFHRGFAWALLVRDMATFLDEAPRLFDLAPIGQLHLPTARLEQWRRFARADWLSRVQSIHFYGTSTPVEPVRELCEGDRAIRLESIVFEASGGPGMPVLLADLLASPTGQRLRSLELRVGPDSIAAADELYLAIAGSGALPQLKQLKLDNLSAGEFGLETFYNSEHFTRLTHLRIARVPGVQFPFRWARHSELKSLAVLDCGLHRQDILGLFRPLLTPRPADLRLLDLSENPIGEWTWTHLGIEAVASPFLRSLILRQTGQTDRSLEYLTNSMFWPTLVELDLRDNSISNTGALALLDAPPPRELTALLLNGNSITSHMADRLRGHYGECVSFGD